MSRGTYGPTIMEGTMGGVQLNAGGKMEEAKAMEITQPQVLLPGLRSVPLSNGMVPSLPGTAGERDVLLPKGKLFGETDDTKIVERSRAGGRRGLRSRMASVASPAQNLAPKVLRFSDCKSKVTKASSEPKRKAQARFKKEVKCFEPLRKVPGVRRDITKGGEPNLEGAANLVNILDRSNSKLTAGGTRGSVSLDHGFQANSSAMCGGGASPLVNYD